MPRCYCARPSPPTHVASIFCVRWPAGSWLSTGCDVVRLTAGHQRLGEDRTHGPPLNPADRWFAEPLLHTDLAVASAEDPRVTSPLCATELGGCWISQAEALYTATGGQERPPHAWIHTVWGCRAGRENFVRVLSVRVLKRRCASCF